MCLLAKKTDRITVFSERVKEFREKNLSSSVGADWTSREFEK